MNNINVKKRNGRLAPLDIKEIQEKTRSMTKGLEGVFQSELEVDAKLQFFEGITTEQIQETLNKTAVDKIDIDRPNWTFVAARGMLKDLYHKVGRELGGTKGERYSHIKKYLEYGEKKGRIIIGLKEKYDLNRINSYIKIERDLLFTYLGLKTLYDRYILKNKKEIPFELPQHLFMGVAMFIAQNEKDPKSINAIKHMAKNAIELGLISIEIPSPEELMAKYEGKELEKEVRTIWAIVFYDLISQFYLMVATPTLSNARTPRHQLSSCYVTSTPDNIEGIFDTYKEHALLSKYGGGIGSDWTQIRSMGGYIDNHKNAAGGLIPFLKIDNDVAVAVDQLGCVAKGSYIKVLKNVRTKDFIHDFRKEYSKIDFSEEDLIDNIAAFASNFAFSYGKFSKNFISSLLFDYIKNSDNLEKLLSIYGLSRDQYKKIIGKFKKINKGLPEGFEILKRNNNYGISKEGIIINIDSLKPLSKRLNRKGYPIVSIGKESITIHKLIVEQYIQENTKGLTIDHKDGNKLNNNIENLKLISNEENISKGWENSYKKRTEMSRIRKHLSNGYKLNGDKRNTHKIDILDIEEEIISIEKARIGDLVKSYNIKENKVEYKAITSKYDIEVKIEDQILLTFENGTTLLTSVWHPTPKINEEGIITYIRADMINKGDVSINDFNEELKVTEVKNPEESSIEFIDLTVKDNSNYFASSNQTELAFALIHNTRKGAIAVYIETWHNDLMDFLDLKKNSGEERRRAHDIFPALWINDLFMKRVQEDGKWTLLNPEETPDLSNLYGEEFEKRYIEYENDDSLEFKEVFSAKEIWKNILIQYFETGTPFLAWKDTANRRNPNKHRGVIRSSNLCVTGDTRLHTQFGLVKAEDLYKMNKEIVATYDKRVCGNKLSFGTDTAACIEMHKTAENADVYEIKTKDGYKIKSTDWHEYYVNRNGNIIKIPLNEINIETDKLLIQSGEGQFGKEGSYELGLITGFVAGDGTFSTSRDKKQQIHIELYNEDINSSKGKIINALAKIESDFGITTKKKNTPKEFWHTEKSKKIRISSINVGELLKDKFDFTKETKLKVPDFVFKGSRYCIKGYLQGLFTSDATVNIINNDKIKTFAIQLGSVSKELLEEVQIILSNFGIRSKITKMREENENTFTYKNKAGEMKEYSSKEFFRLNINGRNSIKFIDKIGFIGEKQEKANNILKERIISGYEREGRKKEYFETEILEIKYIGKEDVYDTTQLLNHSLIFNGIVTGNCTEIFQNTKPNHYKVKIEFEDGSIEYYKETDIISTDEGMKKPAKKITSIDTVNGKKVFFTEKVSELGETAVCNLASINLSKTNTKEKIEFVTTVAIRMLDLVIDLNFYPTRKTKETNMRSRSIGLGVMGEAQLLAENKIHWGTTEHLELIDFIMENISYNAIKASANIGAEKGVYPNYKGSDWSKGLFPIDSANEEAKALTSRKYACDWDSLRKLVKEKGMRNGYLMAIAPTSSISILVGTTQAIEPIYKRKWFEENLSGLIPVVAPNLNPDTWGYYEPAFEMDQRNLIKAGAIRQKWIDQGQSLNIFIRLDKASGNYLNEIYMLGWKLGIKSNYYLRSESPEVNNDVADRSLECIGCQ